jgi:Tfp pilus assembly protein PilW
MTVGLVVLAAASVVVGQATTLTTATQNRVDAAQRARRGVETIVTDLRSAVCAPLSTGTTATPLIAVDANTIDLYANLGNQAALPARRVLSYDATTRAITERVYQGVGTSSSVAIPPAATSTRVLLENVVPVKAGDPIFSPAKYTLDAADPPAVTGFTAIDGTVSATDLPLVTQVTIAVRVRPLSAVADSRRDTVLTVPTTLRYADPLNPKDGVQC